MSVNEVNAPKRFDKLFLGIAIVMFISMAGGTIREYRKYRLGIVEVAKTKEDILELEGRRDRLAKRLEELKKPEVIEKEVLGKLGLVREGETVVVMPTKEPELVDLRMEEKSRERKTYWGEWLRLIK